MLQEATRSTAASVQERLFAVNIWRDLAQRHNHQSELKAMRQTLDLVELAVAESHSLECLSDRLTSEWTFLGTRSIGSDAAALAIQSGDTRLAVSLLERGRSSIFRQLGRYRSVIDDVREVSPNLALRFTDKSAELSELILNAERGKIASDERARGVQDNTVR